MRFTAMNRGQSGKMAMAAAALSAGLLALTGCGYVNAQQTSHQYAASDGTRAEVGPVQLRNMLIVSAGENQPGRVIGAVYNSSSKDVKVTLKGAEGAQTEVPVKQNSYTLLNESADEAILSTSGGKPGSLVDVQVTEDGTNVNKTVKIPVVDGTLKEYAAYVPGGAPSGSATPSQTATPAETASPGETASATPTESH
ncbi:hypothetical protein [Arthrobacter globiformis]|uniref:hypothetical protein n=1 Tax=Arthrobacter globiformis TaxID=1665 RepID=UPI00279016AD|nr:hypothetical protein [Arthrobacter globiformis]MDQ0617053.1 hypothetical protein [Arthrobacter globiformis]